MDQRTLSSTSTTQRDIRIFSLTRDVYFGNPGWRASAVAWISDLGRIDEAIVALRLLHAVRMEWSREYEVRALVAEVVEAERRLLEALRALWWALNVENPPTGG